MNHVSLIGRLAADPEARTTQSGISQCGFRLAVQRRYANAQGVREADFINIVAWRGTADFCTRYFRKGMRVGIEGSIQTRSYQAQDGSKRYVTEVLAENVEFCEDKKDAASAAPAPGAQPLSGQQTDMRAAMAGEGFTEVDDDEMPF